METNETISRRSELCSLCADYLDASVQYLQGYRDDKALKDLENLIANASIPLSFMNDLEKMQEAENADTD